MIMIIRSSSGKDEHLFFDSIDYQCDQCLKVFASEYGLHFHQNMSHPNQSIFCADCNLTFRSHRALKTHQQRLHGLSFEQITSINISSFLFQPFSTEQFVPITSHACEQNRFPLGEFSSKLFSCQYCFIAFPTLNALNYHQVHRHEQYQYDLCRRILDEIILQIEDNTRRTVENNERDFEILLAKQARDLGLINKQFMRVSRTIRNEQHRRIFPTCEHPNRTCANLCLKNLSSYDELLRNYSYKIPIEPKGSPFAQGSIVSKPLINSKEMISTNHKRSTQSKRKSSLSNDFISPKKSSLKINQNYARSLSSISSTSSTSTRSSSKNSRLPSTNRLKRSISPTISLAVERSSEKRRRQREQRKAKAYKLPTNLQEINDDDRTSIKSKKAKQRETSDSSVEYIQVINDDQSSISSLDNIENIKLKSPSNDQDIIICHSSSPTKKSSSINGLHKSTPHQSTEYDDEHIRVRCKICGDILDGRSRFSKHVLTMHSHVIKSTLADMKQQPTPIVSSV